MTGAGAWEKEGNKKDEARKKKGNKKEGNEKEKVGGKYGCTGINECDDVLFGGASWAATWPWQCGRRRSPPPHCLLWSTGTLAREDLPWRPPDHGATSSSGAGSHTLRPPGKNSITWQSGLAVTGLQAHNVRFHVVEPSL